MNFYEPGICTAIKHRCVAHLYSLYFIQQKVTLLLTKNFS